MRKMAFILLILLVVCSCHRRPLELEFIDTCEIPVSIDWSKADLDPDTDRENLYCASIWFYSKGEDAFWGKSFKEFRFTDCRGGTVELPIGHYQVLIINNSVTDFNSGVGFRGTDAFDTFEYYVNSDHDRGGGFVQEPDILAAWRIDEYEVTREMLLGYDDEKTMNDLKKLLNLQPERLTFDVEVFLTVNNLKNAEKTYGVLNGMASSVFVASKKTSKKKTNFAFDFARRWYFANNADGTTHAEFISLGVVDTEDAADSYSADISFRLVGKFNDSFDYPSPDAAPFNFPLTEQMYEVKERKKQIDYDRKIIIALQLASPLPDVVSSRGLTPSVGHWGDEEYYVLPV